LAWIVGAVVLAAGVFTAGYGLANQRHGERAAGDQAAMTARAAQVMPFDLNATRHTFTKTDRGGVQQVLADDPADRRNIELIRAHLQQEAAAFRKGDYSDPAKIHGMDMPGVKELEAGASRVQVRYEPLPARARIAYASSDPVLVAALHAWFDRQDTDHAMPGMGG